MKTASPEPSAPSSGSECARCAHPLRPDWNFCPTCALSVRPEREVLSSEIPALRAAEEAHSASRARTSMVIRWIAAAAGGVLLAGTAGAGFLLLSPQGTRMILPDVPGAPPAEAGAGEPPAGPAIEWVAVPAGPFRYGAPSGEQSFTEEVEIPAFEISKHEVTNALWLEYLTERREDLQARGRWRSSVPTYWTWEEGPGGGTPGFPSTETELPVRGISFEQAVEFCAWLDESARAPGARLPREDEWEKAARGTDGRRYPWGDVFLREIPVPGKTISVEGAVVSPPPSPVGLTATDVSPYGVYHMGGNVSEWTDLWGRRPGEEPGPWERYRVIRGASYEDGAEDGAIYARTYNDDVRMERGISALWVGFRVARSVKEAAPAAGGGR